VGHRVAHVPLGYNEPPLHRYPCSVRAGHRAQLAPHWVWPWAHPHPHRQERRGHRGQQGRVARGSPRL